MPSEIRMPYTKMQQQGNTIDDWLYYVQYPMAEQAPLEESVTVYIFKNERIATEFALRFA